MSEESRARAASDADVTGRTRSERLLWAQLRGRQPGWLAEVPTGQYRLDFFCPELRLAVEVDGAAHRGERSRRYDERRDLWHLQHGIRTIRVSAREVETDMAFVLRHIDQIAGRRRLELAVMPPTAPPVWEPPAAPEQRSRAAGRLRAAVRPALTSVASTPAGSRRPRRRGRREPSAVGLVLIVLALLTFLNNWLGARDAYFSRSGRAADRVAERLTEDLGPPLLIPRPAAGATVCPASAPACGRQLAAAEAQLMADRINMAPRVPPPAADLVCDGTPSPVVHVTFATPSGPTVAEVISGCQVVRVGSEVRRATPAVLRTAATVAN